MRYRRERSQIELIGFYLFTSQTKVFPKELLAFVWHSLNKFNKQASVDPLTSAKIGSLLFVNICENVDLSNNNNTINNFEITAI